MLWVVIFLLFDLVIDFVCEVIWCSVEEYVNFVDQYFNVLWVFIQGCLVKQFEVMVCIFNEGWEIMLVMVEMFNNELCEMELN